MNKFASLALASLASLVLAGCGSAENAKEEAQADNVEMPAEEAVGDVDAAATPVADASAAPGAAVASPAAAETAPASPAAAQ